MKINQKSYNPREESFCLGRETCYGEIDYLDYDCSSGWFCKKPEENEIKQDAWKNEMEKRDDEIKKYMSRISTILNSKFKSADLKTVAIWRQIEKARKDGLDLSDQLDTLFQKELLLKF